MQRDIVVLLSVVIVALFLLMIAAMLFKVLP